MFRKYYGSLLLSALAGQIHSRITFVNDFQFLKLCGAQRHPHSRSHHHQHWFLQMAHYWWDTLIIFSKMNSSDGFSLLKPHPISSLTGSFLLSTKDKSSHPMAIVDCFPWFPRLINFNISCSPRELISIDAISQSHIMSFGIGYSYP
jgi:hypothetical protein